MQTITPDHADSVTFARIQTTFALRPLCVQKPWENEPVMKETEVSVPGVLVAVALSLVATAGFHLSTGRFYDQLNWIWISAFMLSLLTLSASVVNFDLKRIIK